MSCGSVLAEAVTPGLDTAGAGAPTATAAQAASKAANGLPMVVEHRAIGLVDLEEAAARLAGLQRIDQHLHLVARLQRRPLPSIADKDAGAAPLQAPFDRRAVVADDLQLDPAVGIGPLELPTVPLTIACRDRSNTANEWCASADEAVSAKAAAARARGFIVPPQALMSPGRRIASKLARIGLAELGIEQRLVRDPLVEDAAFLEIPAAAIFTYQSS